MVTRDETNQVWEQHRCLNGIPITLKVPTHLKLYVFQNHYLEAVEVGYAIQNGGQPAPPEPPAPMQSGMPMTGSAVRQSPIQLASRRQDQDPTPGNAGQTQKTPIYEICPVALDVVVRDFAHEFMYTEKIFVVDFKRPAAGSSNLRVDMTEEQYFDQIQHDITDSTISAITGLLGASTPGFTGAPAGDRGVGAQPDLFPIRSLVAVGIFEIEAPDFEQQVADFINCHINKAHDAWVVPPATGCVNRVGIPAWENVQVPYPPVPLCPGGGHPVMMHETPPGVAPKHMPGVPLEMLPVPRNGPPGERAPEQPREGRFSLPRG